MSRPVIPVAVHLEGGHRDGETIHIWPDRLGPTLKLIDHQALMGGDPGLWFDLYERVDDAHYRHAGRDWRPALPGEGIFP